MGFYNQFNCILIFSYRRLYTYKDLQKQNVTIHDEYNYMNLYSHPSSLTAYPYQGRRGLELILADIG